LAAEAWRRKEHIVVHDGRITRDGTGTTNWLARLTRRDLVRTITVSAGAVVFAGYGKSNWVTAADKIKITQWYHQYGEKGTQQAAQRYAEAYTKENPNVEVEMVWKPGDYSGTELPAALLTNQGPDVYEGSPTVAMVQAGQVAPLDDLFTPEVKADFDPHDIDVNTIYGHIYAVKMIDDMGLLYCRKSMFDKAGVKPPTTFDEVMSVAKELNSGRTKGLFLGNDGGISAMFTLLPQSTGAEIIKGDKILFNDNKTVAAYTKLKALNDSGVLLIGSPTDWWDPSAFTQSLSAMQWTGLWAMPGIKAAIQDDFEVVPWPAFDANGKPVTFWGGWSEMVNPKGKYVEEAKKFVKWLWIDKKDFQADWALSYGFHVPPRKSVAANAEPLKSGAAKQAVDILYADGQILPPQWTQAMITTLTNAVSNIVKNGADPAKEVASASQKCQDELTKVLSGS
jgi:multiple sugar transport system substrate-binding protein